MVRRPKTLIDRLRRLADAACAHPPRAMSTGADALEDVERAAPEASERDVRPGRPLLDVFQGVGARRLRARLDELPYRLSRREKRTDVFRRLLERCVPQGASLPSSGAHARARGADDGR